jgi:hypothetical protein
MLPKAGLFPLKGIALSPLGNVTPLLGNVTPHESGIALPEGEIIFSYANLLPF